MPVVEIGQMGIQPTKTPMDPTTPDGKILQDAWTAVTSTAGGPSRVFWGVEESDKSKIWAFFDWESLEQHREFAMTSGATATHLFPLVFTPGFTKHAILSSTPLSSPLTRVLLFSFPASFSQAGKDATGARFRGWVERSLRSCGGVGDVSAGWGVEDDFPVRGLGREGETGCLFFVLVGWEGEMGDEVGAGLGEVLEGCVGFEGFWLRCQGLEREGV